MDSDFAEFCWHFIYVIEDKSGPAIRLQKSYRHPELILFGLPCDTARAIFRIFADKIQCGERFATGKINKDILESSPVTLRIVKPAQQALYYYGAPVDDSKAPAEFKEIQPVIDGGGAI